MLLTILTVCSAAGQSNFLDFQPGLVIVISKEKN
jgi:hypothetical protein